MLIDIDGSERHVSRLPRNISVNYLGRERICTVLVCELLIAQILNDAVLRLTSVSVAVNPSRPWSMDNQRQVDLHPVSRE
jgi:hypothetical protein